jgi:hypothetical protein
MKFFLIENIVYFLKFNYIRLQNDKFTVYTDSFGSYYTIDLILLTLWRTIGLQLFMCEKSRIELSPYREYSFDPMYL